MKKLFYLICFSLFLFSCANENKQETAKYRSETELLSLLHEWSNNESLKDTSIAREYGIALDEFVLHYPQNREHQNFLFLAANHANRMRDYQKAASYYSMYSELYPNSSSHADALFASGFLYNNELHNIDSARKYYEVFLLLYPEHMLKDAAEDELAHLGETPEELLDNFKKQQEELTTEPQ